MVARTLDELMVYRKALVACAAVSAVLEKPTLRTDYDLRLQLAAAPARCRQTSPRGLVSKAIASSCDISSSRVDQPTRFARMSRLLTEDCISTMATANLHHKYEEVARMLTGLIKYLRATDRKHRG